MKLPRDLSGDKFARLLCRDWKYQQVHQVGSHIILQTEEPSLQRLALPAHKALRNRDAQWNSASRRSA